MQKKTMKDFTGKKVLFIVENLPSPFDRRVWQEATALRDNGAKVTIICPTGKGYEKKEEEVDGIMIYRHNLPFEADGIKGYLVEYSVALFWESILAWKALFKRGFDVIQICNPPDLLFFVTWPFKLLGKKVIFDHHDINPELYYAKFGRKDFGYKLMLFFEWLTFKTANLCIATNESYKKIAIKRGGRKAKDVTIVRSGPSLKRLKKVPVVPSLKKGRKHLIGYLGVIGKQEGLNYLIDACRYMLDNDRKDVHFICVGGGTEIENIKNYAKEKGVSDYFTFTGRVPDKEMLEALNTADVCVNPDEYNEMNDKSTMNKIMEYMALGKPIVQFDITEGKFSARDASLYAKKNNVVDMAKKILELLDDPKKRKKMGKFGYNRVKNELEWEFEKKKLYGIYEKIWRLK
ncbi:MAG: glycosyltransferase family 4 protein [bacterium]